MAAGPNMDQFEAFFRKADVDGDGRISGAEAVSFFQGSGLPKPVLAQADQSKTGFLGRPEFFNALRLVTVAQSKRDLTPDIVKAALYGPAAAKIPAPHINLMPAAPNMGLPQPRPMPVAANMGAPQPRPMPVAANMGAPQPRPMPAAANMGVPQPRPMPAAANMGTPQPTPMPAGRPPPNQNLGVSGPNVGQNYFTAPPQPTPTAGNISNMWAGPRGTGPSMPTPAPRPQAPVSTPPQPAVNVSKSLVVSGNGVSSTTSGFGDNFFSASSSLPKSSSAAVPASSGPQLSNNNTSINILQDGLSMQPKVGQFQQQPQQQQPRGPSPGSTPLASSGISVGMAPQLPWPKMKPTDVQKYTKVFMEVDTDRDGKITGEEARNLFLSWRLPREVLKQVWDLSDQDNDNMLSLREFCFALYLMERFREGRPLPNSLPSNVMLDETLLSMTGQPKVNYGNAAWSPSPGTGFGQQPGMPGAQPRVSAANLRPPMPAGVPKPGGVQSNQQNLRLPVLEDSFLDQRGNGQGPPPAGQKVDETKSVILDSKEKIELYRTKMQELVLYKSRCDNKLNEITERASADKREAESLGKKYEERYKQVAEIASKLTIEEATFRDIQERKTELNQAIIKMEQGGSVDGILQVRSDRIQYDLEELVKALNERCKKHGLQVKSSAVIELPNGWEPGIQEGAAVWDEDWDKFEDEGFLNDLKIDVKNVSQSISVQKQAASPHGTLESESVFAHNEDEYGRSPNDSPAGRTAGSPSQAFSEVDYGKDSEADAEIHRSFDDSTWSAFDNNDDVDSVWGFGDQKTNDGDSEKHRDFFGSDSFSVRSGSPNASSFQRKSPFNFDDSVPSTPLSRFGSNSPRYSEAGGDHYFDNFSRFDSFSTHDGGFSAAQPERLTRFDSMNSSKDFGSNAFSRFDSISSSRDFGGGNSRFDNSSRDFGHNAERLTRFDSMNSSKDFGFDDTDDPFGSSGPFKVSSESSKKGGSDNWNAF